MYLTRYNLKKVNDQIKHVMMYESFLVIHNSGHESTFKYSQTVVIRESFL